MRIVTRGSFSERRGALTWAVESEWSCLPKCFCVEGHPPQLDVQRQCALEEIIVQYVRHRFQIAHPPRGERRTSFLDPIFPARWRFCLDGLGRALLEKVYKHVWERLAVAVAAGEVPSA